MRLEHMELTFGNATHKFAVSFPLMDAASACSKFVARLLALFHQLVPHCMAPTSAMRGGQHWVFVAAYGQVGGHPKQFLGATLANTLSTEAAFSAIICLPRGVCRRLVEVTFAFGAIRQIARLPEYTCGRPYGDIQWPYSDGAKAALLSITRHLYCAVLRDHGLADSNPVVLSLGQVSSKCGLSPLQLSKELMALGVWRATNRATKELEIDKLFPAI